MSIKCYESNVALSYETRSVSERALFSSVLPRIIPFLLAVFLSTSIFAQDVLGPFPADARSAPVVTPRLFDPTTEARDLGDINPISILGEAGNTLERLQSRGGGGGTPSGGPSESTSHASGLSTALNIVILLTVLTLVPSVMLMTTCFLRIVVVLGLLKQAIGTQTLPPPQVVLGLSLFMTLLVMSPTLDRLHAEAVVPYASGEIKDYDELWERVRTPIRDFMFAQIDRQDNWSSVYMVLNYRGIDTSDPGKLTRADVDMISLVPAFMLSELKTAFLIGFRVYLPFLVIDMVIASLLISMGMMMLPPVLISLPFKLLLFVLVDGWQLIVGSLMASFAVGGAAGFT